MYVPLVKRKELTVLLSFAKPCHCCSILPDATWYHCCHCCAQVCQGTQHEVFRPQPILHDRDFRGSAFRMIRRSRLLSLEHDPFLRLPTSWMRHPGMLAVINSLCLGLSLAAERQLDHVEMSQHNRVRDHLQIHGRSLSFPASQATCRASRP